MLVQVNYWNQIVSKIWNVDFFKLHRQQQTIDAALLTFNCQSSQKYSTDSLLYGRILIVITRRAKVHEVFQIFSSIVFPYSLRALIWIYMTMVLLWIITSRLLCHSRKSSRAQRSDLICILFLHLIFHRRDRGLMGPNAASDTSKAL